MPQSKIIDSDELPDMVADLLVWMSTLTTDERMHVFGLIKDTYCPFCGRVQDDGRRCQCTNDE